MSKLASTLLSNFHAYFLRSRWCDNELLADFVILVFTSQQLFNGSKNDHCSFCYFFHNGSVDPDKEKLVDPNKLKNCQPKTPFSVSY